MCSSTRESATCHNMIHHMKQGHVNSMIIGALRCQGQLKFDLDATHDVFSDKTCWIDFHMWMTISFPICTRETTWSHVQQVRAQVIFRQVIVFYMRIINWRSNVLEFSVPNDYTWSHTITRAAVCSRTLYFHSRQTFNMCVIDVHMWYSVSHVQM